MEKILRVQELEAQLAEKQKEVADIKRQIEQAKVIEKANERLDTMLDFVRADYALCAQIGKLTADEMESLGQKLAKTMNTWMKKSVKSDEAAESGESNSGSAPEPHLPVVISAEGFKKTRGRKSKETPSIPEEPLKVQLTKDCKSDSPAISLDDDAVVTKKPAERRQRQDWTTEAISKEAEENKEQPVELKVPEIQTEMPAGGLSQDDARKEAPDGTSDKNANKKPTSSKMFNPARMMAERKKR